MRKRGIAILFISIIVLQFSSASGPILLKFDIISDVGTAFPSNKQLDSYLETHGFCKTSKDDGFSTLAVGFRMYDTTSHAMLELLYSKNEYYSIGDFSKINSHGYQINFLYNLSKNSNWILAPRLSLICSDYNLTALSTNYNSNLSGQKLEEGFATNDVFDLQIGPTFERKVVILSFPVYFGLNVFYNIELGKHVWENLNGNRLQVLPPFNTNGFGFKFRVGLSLN